MAKPTTQTELTFLMENRDMVIRVVPYAEDAVLEKEGMVRFTFYECEPDPWWLHNLRERFIPYTFDYGSHSEWNSGTEYFRYDDLGNPVLMNVHDDHKNPDLDQLKDLLETPMALVEFIKLHIEKVTPLSWSTQSEYAKRARLKKLVTSP